jgi:hypothetical protein
VPDAEEGRPIEPARETDPAWLIWLASALVPASIIAWLIATNVVDVPYWDDWFNSSRVIINWHAGTLGLADLLETHNESRPFFPRLLFLALGEGSRGRMTLQPAVGFALACLISWSVVLLGTRTLRSRRAIVLGVCSLACLLVFTPRQGETWLWATTAISFIPVASLAIALVALGSRCRPMVRFLAAALACVFATWSFAQGLVTWIAITPAVVILLGARWLAGWLALFAVNVVAYLHGYATPAHHPPLAEALGQPLRAVHYFVAFLGNPLAADRLWLADVVGGTALLMLSVAVAYSLALRHDVGLRRRMVSWLSLAAFSVGSAGLSALGRSPLGIRQAMSGRYVPYALYLPVALLFLTAIVAADLPARSSFQVPRRRIRLAAILLAAGFLALHAASFVAGTRAILWTGRMLRHAKSCLLFVEAAPDEGCLTARVLPDVNVLRRFAAELDRLGYLRPSLVRSRRLQDLQGHGASPGDGGVFEEFVETETGLTVSGWAVLPTRHKIADAVILAVEAPNGDWVPWSFEAVQMPKPGFTLPKGWPTRYAGWERAFDARQLPPRPFHLSAWAFDAEWKQAWLLQRTYRVGR